MPPRDDESRMALARLVEAHGAYSAAHVAWQGAMRRTGEPVPELLREMQRAGERLDRELARARALLARPSGRVRSLTRVELLAQELTRKVPA